MKLEMEFPGSEISEVKATGKDLEIIFSHIMIIAPPNSSAQQKMSGVTGKLLLIGYKCKKLPKKGVLSDGELYGIPNKPLNGKVPMEFHYKKDCELELTIDNVDYTISAKGISVIVDVGSLPNELRH